MKLQTLITSILLAGALNAHSETVSVTAAGLTPAQAVQVALDNNPEIAAFKARAEAESSLIKNQYFLDNPKVGIMHERDMNAGQMASGSMNSWMISQEIKFPTKYFSQGSAQTAKANSAKAEWADKALEMRQQTLSAYYAYFSSQKILALLEAQKETLREIARVAESRRASGKAPQQDEMKAHVEQTLIENGLILQRQESFEIQSRLNVILNTSADSAVNITTNEIKSPTLVKNLKLDTSSALNSKMLEAKKHMVENARVEKNLAYQGYLPDFMVTYKKPYGGNTPDNAYAAGVEISLPLWFLTKQNGESSSASAKYQQAQREYESAKQNTEAQALSLKSKVESYSKLLTIYETSLIPQAQGAHNSSRAAYTAGRVGFQEFLDTERSLYAVRIDYYKNISKFVEAITMLERLIGESISSLPFEGVLK